ncbi:MAG: AtpZ/AtpI family protein [Pirellulales bacterium]
MTIPPDDRSLYAVASQWVSRVMTVSLEMVVPGLIGLWLDGRIGSTPLFTLAGFGLGITTAIWHLLQMTAEKQDGREPKAGRRDGSEGHRSK